MIKVPIIECQMENHFHMPFQYVCTNALCLKNTQQLACLYCCQELHQEHVNDIKALKTVIAEAHNSIEKTEYGAGEILLQGIKNCKSEDDLRQNLSQLMCYHKGGSKYEKLMDKNCIQIKEATKQFYEKRGNRGKNRQDLQKTIKKKKQRLGECSDTIFITPVLTFSQDDAIQQGYIFKSPFSVVNRHQELVTAFAYPPLNRFHESVELTIKVERVTPFWLGIGVSFDKHKYEDKSKNHILLTSNGWVSTLGEIQQSSVKFCSRDNVKVNWDKRRELIEFKANGERHAIDLPLKWNRDVYLCVVLYYKEDCVQIMA